MNAAGRGSPLLIASTTTDDLRPRRLERSRVEFEGPDPTLPKSNLEDGRTGMGRADAAAGRIVLPGIAQIRSVPRRLPRLPSTNVWDGHQYGASRFRTKDLRGPDQHQGHRTMRPDDHRPRRPRPRPDLRLRHDRLRRRAVGQALDHDRHEPRRARPRALAPDGREVPVVPPRRLGGRHPQGGRADRPGAADPAAADLERRPPRLRVRARAARDPEVDRPEPRHPRGHEPRGDRRRDRPPRRDRDPVRSALRGPQDRPGVRARSPSRACRPIGSWSTARRTPRRPR